VCPECIASLALIYAGVASMGALTVLVMKMFHRQAGGKKTAQNNPDRGKEGEQYEPSESRIARNQRSAMTQPRRPCQPT
jgi:hypothetical protein